MTNLIGRPAPLFTAPAAFAGEKMNDAVREVSLSDFRGRWLALMWYPLDFTFVCPTEILALSDRLDDFGDLDAAVVAASTDSVYSHRAWMRTPRRDNGIEGVRFPIISDKSHRIARSYGVLLPSQGVALRALFLIDPDGKVQYSVVHNLSIGRSVGETLRVLEALQTGDLCGSDWRPGQETLGQ